MDHSQGALRRAERYTRSGGLPSFTHNGRQGCGMGRSPVASLHLYLLIRLAFLLSCIPSEQRGCGMPVSLDDRRRLFQFHQFQFQFRQAAAVVAVIISPTIIRSIESRQEPSCYAFNY